jgi:hypothetical protein
VEPAVLHWLLGSDPSLRWQVERDVAAAPPEVWQATRTRVATEGFGRILLSKQDADGQWAGGAYFPKNFDFQGPEAVEGAGQPYTATTWTLNMLRDFGLDAAALKDTANLLAANSRWEYDNLPYWGGEVDCCINAFTLANGVWLGADVAGIADWFQKHQMPDGGWNCQWVHGAQKSSLHSTLNSLKGLLAYEVATGGSEPLRSLRHAGEEYLLKRGLMRRLSTGALIAPWVTQMAYPFRWKYSVLHAADYFRAASLYDGKKPDLRLAEAIATIEAARESDGKWLQQAHHPGKVWLEVDAAPGEPSRWLTFYASRLLVWWQQSGQS